MDGIKIITSPENEEIKSAKKLHDSKNRKQEKLFFFEGIHLLEEFLKNKKTPFRIFFTQEAFDKYESIVKKELSEKIRIIPQRIYSKITAENAPQGIFTIADFSSLDIIRQDDEFILENISKKALLLESMRDPGNVGTVIRTAASLGVDIIFTEDSADLLNSKTIRASMGALFAQKIYITPSASLFAQTAVSKGFNVFGAILDEKAEKLGSFQIPENSVFIIGNEGAGLKKETIESCNKYAYIPMTGKTESLNAAVASSIIMWEISKETEK